MPSPTQRSLKKLRDEGWACQVVEKFNSFTKRRIDVFGYGDILAIRPGCIALVQTTSGPHISDRMKKIYGLPGFKAWHAAGGLTILHGWRKLKTGWTCREFTTSHKNPEYWEPWSLSMKMEPGIKLLFIQDKWKPKKKAA